MHNHTKLAPVLALLLGCGAAPGPAIDDKAAPIHIDLPPPSPPPPAANTDGSLKIDPGLLFFDHVCPGDAEVRTLTVRNAGKDDVQLQDLSVSGSNYTLGAHPALPRTLSPGQHVRISVQFSPDRDRLTPYAGSLTLDTDDPVHPTYNVSLQGLVLPATVLVTPADGGFGDLDVGTTGVVHLKLSNNGLCQADIVRSRIRGALADWITLGELPTDPLAPGGTFRLDATLDCHDVGDADVNIRFFDGAGRSVASSHLTGSCL